MRLIYFSKEDEEKATELLKEKDRFSRIIISTEHGKYKKGEYVKSTGGQRLLVIDSKIITDLDHFKRECAHYPELKNTNLDEIKQAFTHKKIEIIELKKYRK